MKKIFLYLLMPLMPFATKAQERVSTNPLQIFQTANKSKLPTPHTIHPDFAQVRMSKTGGKWRNMLGMNICAAQYNTNKIGLALHVNPYVELHDFSKKQPMSWQLWRGHLGGNLYFTSHSFNKKIHKNFEAIVGVGFTHESQHVSNYEGFGRTFLNNFYNYDAGDIRTYEYWETNLLLKQKINSRVQIFANSAFKYFPQPISSVTNYDLKSAINTEIGVVFTANKNVQLHANYFGERIFNTFKSQPGYNANTRYYEYIKPWNQKPFKYNHIETGIILKNADANASTFNIFIGYFNGNGRGLDFINQYSEMYGGIKILL